MSLEAFLEEGVDISLSHSPPLCVFQAHLRPLPGAHPHLRDLPLLRVPPHLQVCLLPGCLLQGMELEGARPLHPLSPQPRALVVGGLVPPAWLQPLREPNFGKSAR